MSTFNNDNAKDQHQHSELRFPSPTSDVTDDGHNQRVRETINANHSEPNTQANDKSSSEQLAPLLSYTRIRELERQVAVEDCPLSTIANVACQVAALPLKNQKPAIARQSVGGHSAGYRGTDGEQLNAGSRNVSPTGLHDLYAPADYAQKAMSFRYRAVEQKRTCSELYEHLQQSMNLMRRDFMHEIEQLKQMIVESNALLRANVSGASADVRCNACQESIRKKQYFAEKEKTRSLLRKPEGKQRKSDNLNVYVINQINGFSPTQNPDEYAANDQHFNNAGAIEGKRDSDPDRATCGMDLNKPRLEDGQDVNMEPTRGQYASMENRAELERERQGSNLQVLPYRHTAGVHAVDGRGQGSGMERGGQQKAGMEEDEMRVHHGGEREGGCGAHKVAAYGSSAGVHRNAHETQAGYTPERGAATGGRVNGTDGLGKAEMTNVAEEFRLPPLRTLGSVNGREASGACATEMQRRRGAANRGRSGARLKSGIVAAIGKRRRDNWTEQENGEFSKLVLENQSLEEMDLRRMLAKKFSPRRSHEQCANHLRILRAQGKLPASKEDGAKKR